MNEACEKQFRGFLFGGEYIAVSSTDKIADTMEEMQQQRRKIETDVEGFRKHADKVRKTAGLTSNSHMREITANLKRRDGSSSLICPVCGGDDQGNRINGKPVCMMIMKHNGLGPVQLMTPEKAKMWKPPKKPVKVSYTFNELKGVTKTRHK